MSEYVDIYTIDYSSMMKIYNNGEVKKNNTKDIKNRIHINGKITYSQSKKYCISYDFNHFKIFKF